MVVVAVKVPEHRRAVTASIAAGKDVLCEWPLGNGVNEANEMAELARAAGIRGFVGLQARAAPPLRFLNDLIAAGEIGEILSTTLVGCGDRWGPTIPPEVSYLIDRDNGATMLTVAMGHSLEALCRCLGELVELSATTATRRRRVRVTGTDEELSMTAEDEIAVTGRLQSGAVAAIHYSGGTSPYPGLRWRIRGTRGTLELRGASGHLQYGRVEIFRSIGTEGEELAPLAVPDEYQLAPVSPDSLSCAVANGYALLARDLAGTTTWTATFADAVRRHRCLAAIELAALSGERQLIG